MQILKPASDKLRPPLILVTMIRRFGEIEYAQIGPQRPLSLRQRQKIQALSLGSRPGRRRLAPEHASSAAVTVCAPDRFLPAPALHARPCLGFRPVLGRAAQTHGP